MSYTPKVKKFTVNPKDSYKRRFEKLEQHHEAETQDLLNEIERLQIQREKVLEEPTEKTFDFLKFKDTWQKFVEELNKPYPFGGDKPYPFGGDKVDPDWTRDFTIPLYPADPAPLISQPKRCMFEGLPPGNYLISCDCPKCSPWTL